MELTNCLQALSNLRILRTEIQNITNGSLRQIYNDLKKLFSQELPEGTFKSKHGAIPKVKIAKAYSTELISILKHIRNTKDKINFLSENLYRFSGELRGSNLEDLG